MSKYTKELMQYLKASAIFEYAVNNYLRDKKNHQLLEEVNSSYEYLMEVAYPVIESLYKTNSDDPDAIVAYKKASKDQKQMQKLYNNLSNSYN